PGPRKHFATSTRRKMPRASRCRCEDRRARHIPSSSTRSRVGARRRGALYEPGVRRSVRMNDDPIRAAYEEWTKGRDAVAARIALFERVRDLAYEYPASRDPVEVLQHKRG